MDYENNEKQIQWSKMHARKLIEIMEMKRKEELGLISALRKNKDVLDYLTEDYRIVRTQKMEK